MEAHLEVRALPSPREQTPDAGAFEIVVVAAVVGGDEELHARIGPNFAVVLRDAGDKSTILPFSFL